MARPVIAVTDSPFPSLDPAKAALARLDPELRMAASAAAPDILAVAPLITHSNVIMKAGSRTWMSPVVGSTGAYEIDGERTNRRGERERSSNEIPLSEV